jgi:hypothetical protein
MVRPSPMVSAVPAGPDPGALLDGAALRVPFPAPAAGEVKEFDGVRRHREDGRQFVELVRRGAVVGDGVPHFQQPADVKGEGGFHREPGVRVRLDNDCGAAVGACCHNAEAGREIKAGDAVGSPGTAQGGPAAPGGRRLGE